MASPNSTFTELVTTTFRNHPKMITDNVGQHNALYRRLTKRGKVSLLDGGYEIVRPLLYAEGGNYQRFSGYDVLNIGASDVMTAANYAWKQVALNVTASGMEIRSNSGKERILNLVEQKIEGALISFGNNMSEDLYSDGLTANQINGLQATVSDAGTGTIGGIISGNYTWWKNVVQSDASPIQGGSAVTISKTTIQTQWNNLWMDLTRGADRPDIIVASNNYFNFYEESLTDLKRYTSDEEAQGGFIALKYKTADVFHDGGSKGGGIAASHAYFLNTRYLELCVHKDANLQRQDDKMAVNQDAVVIPFIWMGNLVTSNRSLQGVHKA